MMTKLNGDALQAMREIELAKDRAIGHCHHLQTYVGILQNIIRDHGVIGCTCNTPCDNWAWFGDYIEHQMCRPGSKISYGQYRLSMASVPLGDKCKAKQRNTKE